MVMEAAEARSITVVCRQATLVNTPGKEGRDRSRGHAGIMPYTPGNVRDVPAQTFIRAYAAHLKANDQVRRGACSSNCGFGTSARGFRPAFTLRS